MQLTASAAAGKSRSPNSRRWWWILGAGVAAAVVLSVTVASTLLAQRHALEIEVTDLVIAPDAPQADMTQLHVSLVVRNAGPATVHLQLLTVFVTAANQSVLFDTFSLEAFDLSPGATQTFPEVTNVTGVWSEAAFTVKVFPFNAPSWESPLIPEQPVTWTA